MAKKKNISKPLSETNPELVLEWELEKNLPLQPELISAGSNKKVYWKCKEGHIWEAVIASRAINGNGCPFCSGRKILSGYNDLATKNPQLITEWDYEKNKGILPEEVSPYSHKKVWWKCLMCNFEWCAEIKSRNGGCGCPECGKRKLSSIQRNNKLRERGSLADNNPRLAQEWHPTKNGLLTANDVLAGTNQKVWWLCDNGHEWEADIASRNAGVGCPFCGRNSQGKNNRLHRIAVKGSLSQNDPVLAGEWHPTKNGDLHPEQVMLGTNIKVWWLGKCGHEWQATVASRAMYHLGCPYCSGKLVLSGYNDLATKNPNLLSEWDYDKNNGLLPERVSPNSHIKVWWKCNKCGNEWQAEIKSRNYGSGCILCGFKQSAVTRNQQKVAQGLSLADVHPKLSKEWDFYKNGELTPNDVLPGSNLKVRWICRKGHEWEAVISSRAMMGTGCPICSNEQHTSFPEQTILFYFSSAYEAIGRYKFGSKEIDVYIPELKIGIEYDGRFYHSTEIKLNKEEEKREYLKSEGIRLLRVKEGDADLVVGDTIYYKYDYRLTDLPWAIHMLCDLIGDNIQFDIDINRDRSKIYEQYIALEKQNSITIKCPELVNEWNYEKNGKLQPETLSYSSNKKVWWICSKGHEWQAVVGSRARGGFGCPYCSGHKVIEGENDLASINPSLSKEWLFEKNGALLPSQVKANSNKKVWWRCSAGHEWQAIIAHRNQGHGCPFCSGQRVLVGYNDLITKNPDLAAEWDYDKNYPLTPQDFTAGSGKKAWWKCSKCGNSWIAVIGSRNKGCGCPKCKGYIKSIANTSK